jgi:hypothetical protein
MRPPPPEAPPEAIAATDLRIGDCFFWGDIHMTVLSLERTEFVSASCAGQSEITTIDLHPLEEVLVHTPRPTLQPENPR